MRAGVSALTESKSADDVISNLDMMQRMGSQHAAAIREYLSVKSDLEAIAAEPESQRTDSTATLASLLLQENEIEGGIQLRRQLIAGVESEITALPAHEDAARAPLAETQPGARGPTMYPPHSRPTPTPRPL